MGHSNRELWAAFIAIIIVTLIYLFIMSQLGGIPAASGFFGHGLGIVGFIFMMMTEILYSWRKRSRSARWGRMSSWLRFHIFTGLVGPYMVLLHSSWKFNGLAGIVMLLTVIIVLSGIVGRYIYTAIPRTADGAEIESAELDRQTAIIEVELQKWSESQPEVSRVLSQSLSKGANFQGSSSMEVFGRAFSDLSYRLEFWLAKRRLKQRYRSIATELEGLLKRKRTLQRQVSSVILARRLLSIWHAVHIPIGAALFSAAFVPMSGAIYYATLLR